MRINLSNVVTAVLIACAGAPLAARAELSVQQKTQITAAVDAAMATGNTGPLQKLLTTIVTASPDDAAAVATVAAQEIDKDQAADPGKTLDGSDTTIAEAVTTATVVAIVSAAPGQAGAVLEAAQANFSPDLIVAAITATQTALAPAAGGNQPGNNGNGNGNNNAPPFNPVSQTAEVPRQSTASPSS